MKILLLGRDGQVGWQLQRSLAPHGYVVAYSRSEADLSDLEGLRRLVCGAKPDVIVNAAAYTAVDKAESEKDLAFRINAEAPGVLAEETAKLGSLLVHYSTDYVFDGEKATAYSETDQASPQSVYGSSKLAGERAISKIGCKALIFRTSWVFGARGGNFVKTILRLAAERDSLTVVDDQFGSPTPAALIATVTGVALAMLRQGRAMSPGEQRLYHLAASRPVSWCEFARTIVVEAEGRGDFNLKLGAAEIHAIPTSGYPTPAKRPRNSRLDCHKLERDFGLIMPDWQPYLERMLQLLALKRNGY